MPFSVQGAGLLTSLYYASQSWLTKFQCLLGKTSAIKSTHEQT